MISWLLSLVNPLSAIVNAIANERAAYYNATTDVAKAKIQANIDALQAQRDVLIADSTSKTGWIDQVVRAGLALPFVVYFNKLIIWDKVIGSWPNYTTDGLSNNDLYALGFVLSFFFLTSVKLFK